MKEKYEKRVLEVFKSYELIETITIHNWDGKEYAFHHYEIISNGEYNGIKYYPVLHSGNSKSYIKKCWKKIKERI